MKSIIQVTNLSKTFPATNKQSAPFVAVDDISFKLKDGEILGLLGPNGAGKSTTISMLLGVLTPSSGKISYFGKDFYTHRSSILEKVTFASTYIRMPWRLTVIENLRVYGYMYGLDKSTFNKRSEKFLNRFGVWEQRNKTMNNLSAGQVTRVMLAKAFIPHPKIVLLDEPTASLDPDIAHQIRGFIKEQQSEFKTSILYTSHNMDEVTDVCDRVMFLKKGKIIASDTPQNLVNSIGTSRLRLLIIDGLKRLESILSNNKIDWTTTGRDISINLPQDGIPSLLHNIAKNNITYSNISITKPTLEDYFLSIAKSII